MMQQFAVQYKLPLNALEGSHQIVSMYNNLMRYAGTVLVMHYQH